MSRGSVRCLSLLVCVCFTLSMLFSDILRVKAAQVTNFSRTITLYSTAESVTLGYYNQSFNTTDNFNYREIDSSTGSTGSGSSSGSSVGTFFCSKGQTAGSYHFKVPMTINENLPSDLNERNISWYYLNRFGSLSYNITAPSGVSEFHCENLAITNSKGELLVSLRDSTDSHYMYNKGSEVFANSPPTKFGYNFYLEFDVSWKNYQSDALIYENLRNIVGFSVTLSGWFSIDYAGNTDPEADSVTDSETHQQLDTLNESTEAIEESVTSDTGGGLLATIKNFFGSFFQNVFDTLVSVFVPEDGFFSDWFNRLNTLLSEKLGMLYAPFDLLITTLNAIMNADTTDTGIPFPGIQWEDTYLVEPFTFYFSSLGDTFTDLQGYVYFATDTVLLFAFLYLLQNKIRLILEGHESG